MSGSPSSKNGNVVRQLRPFFGSPEQIALRQQKSPAKNLDVLRTALRCAVAAALRAGIPPWAVCGELDEARQGMEQ